MQLAITTFRPDLVCAHLIDVDRDGAVAHSLTATPLAAGCRITIHDPADPTCVRLQMDRWAAVRLLDSLDDDRRAVRFVCGPIIAATDDRDDVVLCDRAHGELSLAHNDATLLALALRAALAQSGINASAPACA